MSERARLSNSDTLFASTTPTGLDAYPFSNETSDRWCGTGQPNIPLELTLLDMASGCRTLLNASSMDAVPKAGGSGSSTLSLCFDGPFPCVASISQQLHAGALVDFPATRFSVVHKAVAPHTVFIVEFLIGINTLVMKYTFDRSPVNELVLGVQYEAPVFAVSDEFRLYEKVREEYPEISEVLPLPSVIEDATAAPSQRFLSAFASRKYFINRQRDRLVQVQPDRLLFNWRKDSDESTYPRFATVFESFRNLVDTVDGLLKAKLPYNQYEITYVDHVPLKSLGLDIYDITDIFVLLRPMVLYKSISIDYSIPQQEIGGVVSASLKSGVRKDTKEKILVLQSTCRGFRPQLSLEEWFSKAHILLLDHFLSVITEKAKIQWGFREE